MMKERTRWGGAAMLLGLVMMLLFGMTPTLRVANAGKASSGLEPPPPRNIMLIGWDGCQRDHLKECLSRNECPNLVQLAKEGALMQIDVTPGQKTDTKAGWSQILTGYDAEKTGVYNNAKYQPIPEGWSLVERLENKFGPDNIVTVFLAGKLNHVGARGPHVLQPRKFRGKSAKETPADGEDLKITELKTTQTQENAKAPERDKGKGKIGRKGKRAGKAAAEVAKGGKKGGRKGAGKGAVADNIPAGGRMMKGEPHFYAKQHADVFENGLKAADNVGAKVLADLEKYKDQRFFFFIHFEEPDPQGHRFGENSQQYTDGIIGDDKWLGKIVATLKELGLYDQTRIYVTADHGFNEGAHGHGNAPYVFLATNDRAVGQKGERRDIAPTILWRFGFDLSRIEPPLDGRPLKRVEDTSTIW